MIIMLAEEKARQAKNAVAVIVGEVDKMPINNLDDIENQSRSPSLVFRPDSQALATIDRDDLLKVGKKAYFEPDSSPR